MREEFEKMAAAGKLERQHIEALVELTNTGFCMHRSWGFGRIKTVDTVFARFMIDFDNKAGHTMDLAFAAESLKPIAKDHILARKAVGPGHAAADGGDATSGAGEAGVEQLRRQGDGGPDPAGARARGHWQ